MEVAPRIVSDELWRLVRPLLPRKRRRFRYPGRKRLGDREALPGILFVLHTGIAWLHRFKRLLVRYGRRAETHEAFLALGCCLVCFRRLRRSF